MQRRKRRDLSTSLLEYGSRVRLKPEFTRSGLGVIEGRGMCIFVDGGMDVEYRTRPWSLTLGRHLLLKSTKTSTLNRPGGNAVASCPQFIPSMRDWRPHRCITVTSNDMLSGRTERSESEQNLAMRRTKTVVYLRVTEC
jgi:hypothetical protein